MPLRIMPPPAARADRNQPLPTAASLERRSTAVAIAASDRLSLRAAAPRPTATHSPLSAAFGSRPSALSAAGASAASTRSKTVDITPLLGTRPVDPEIEAKRALNHWVPGNKVSVISHNADLQEDNSEMINWLKDTDYFTADAIAKVIATPESDHAWEVNNPILNQPIAESLRDTIRSAQQTLYIDIFLMGGTWGLDIAKELLLASERGVQVVLVRDTDNRFSSGFEMDPLWDALEAHSHQNENLTVMRAQIKNRPSGLPFGLDQITRLFDNVVDAPLSLEAKSDHSKIVIADGLSRKPQMWVGSKNTVDSGGSFFYDEVMHVEGPAAAASFMSYLPDMELAHQLALDEKVNNSEPADGWFSTMVQTMRNRRDGSERTVCDAVGSASVLIAENNADDSIRNIEHTVLSLIESATDSIDMYQFLAYSPEIGKALAAAVKRGVNVRILMDSVGQKVPMNATLGYFMDDAGLTPEQVESMIRWRAQLPGGTQIDGDTENPIEPQQQHVKTIVVDEKIVFGGSTNFDIASLAGAFREFSIAVKDNDAATKSHENFNEIFASETHSVPYETLIPQNPSWIERLRNRIIKDILLTESWRIGALGIMNKLTRL